MSIKKNLIILLLSLVLVANVISMWPYSIHFYNWRLNILFFAIFSIYFSTLIIRLSVHFKMRFLRYSIMAVGVIISLCCLFSTFGQLLFDSPNSLGNDDFELRSDIQIGKMHYRLYADNRGGVYALPTAILQKEIDTNLGFKLIHSEWSSAYYCCFLKLESNNKNNINVIDKATGLTLVTVNSNY